MKRWKLWYLASEILGWTGLVLAYPGILICGAAEWCRQKGWASKPVNPITDPNFVRATEVE